MREEVLLRAQGPNSFVASFHALLSINYPEGGGISAKVENVTYTDVCKSFPRHPRIWPQTHRGTAANSLTEYFKCLRKM